VSKEVEVFMTRKTIELTKDGLARLQAELNDLLTVKRAEATEAIKNARSLGDLSENSLYDQARAKQSFIEGRIQELESIIEQAKIVEGPATGEVGLGSKVVVHIDGDEEEFMIVGEPEADPANAKLSHTSPLGKALLGKKVGDVVEVDAPVGTITYRVEQVN
jgi:transcription elongation factor GreA